MKTTYTFADFETANDEEVIRNWDALTPEECFIEEDDEDGFTDFECRDEEEVLRNWNLLTPTAEDFAD